LVCSVYSWCVSQ
jgi:hypothetical protein